MAEYTSTTNQGLTIPDDDDSFLNSVPDYIKALAEDVEVQLVMRFANMGDFTTKVTSPVNGMVFWVESDAALYVWANGGENRVWPTDPALTYGSGMPTATGAAGAVYFDIDSAV